MSLAPLMSVALAAALAGEMTAQAPLAARGFTYRLTADSRLEVHVGKAGLLAGAGHEHLVRARTFSGSITYEPDHPTDASVTVSVSTEGLYVVPASDSADIPRITATMRDRVLRVRDNPEIKFVSKAVVGTTRGVHVEGALTILGHTRPVAFDAELRFSGDTLEGTASFSVRQTDFGIRPYSTALGLVKVADQVNLEIRLKATRQ